MGPTVRRPGALKLRSSSQGQVASGATALHQRLIDPGATATRGLKWQSCIEQILGISECTVP